VQIIQLALLHISSYRDGIYGSKMVNAHRWLMVLDILPGVGVFDDANLHLSRSRFLAAIKFCGLEPRTQGVSVVRPS
jgi:hypothetical protein